MGRKPIDDEARARRLELGRRIDLARVGIDISKSALAAACGVSPATVTGWLTGRHAPTPESLVAISRATRKPAAFFEVGGLDDRDAREVFERELVRLVGAKIASEVLELSSTELRERLSSAGEATVSEFANGFSAFANALFDVLSADELRASVELILTAAELGMVDELIVAQLASAKSLAKRLGVDVENVSQRAERLVG